MTGLCALLLLALIVSLAPLAAQAQDLEVIAGHLQEIAGEIEHIAEDMEEIHHDMHKITFSLRLMSYASIGIFVMLLAGLIVPAIKKTD